MVDAIEIIGINNNMYYGEDKRILKYITNLNKINIFIGENNSGKSKLMRFMIREETVKALSNDFVYESIQKSVELYKKNIVAEIVEFNRYSRNNKIELREDLFEISNVDFYLEIRKIIDGMNLEGKNLNYNENTCISEIEKNMCNLLNSLTQSGNFKMQTSISRLRPIYIPILRGIENYNIYYDTQKSDELIDTITMNEKQREAIQEYKDNSKHIYQNKIKLAYSINEKFIFTAEDLYDEITSKLLGKEQGRNFIKEFQEFISKEFYEGKEFTIIPQKREGYLNVRIDKQERPLHDLGDGIKQIITLLYKIFEYKDNEKIFFIEEPEMNLHPGFQRKFIEILQLPIFKKHQYFITTHSNHLIDSCFNYDNISIYKFINMDNSNNKFQILSSSHDDVSILELLGVNNSSVFIANCTIWVEGISDKILIKKYLEIYFKKHNINNLKEDINYAFVEYGGNCITHWSFVPNDSIETINSSGITNRSFIICDNDNDSPNKKRRKENLKKIFKENYYELTVREIENTISKKVLEKMLFPNNEVKLKKDVYQKDYMNKKVYMGRFIDNHYELSRMYSTKNGTGTITNKLKFARDIVENINTYEDLSIQAINLCKKLTKFINKANNR